MYFKPRKEKERGGETYYLICQKKLPYKFWNTILAV